MGLPTRYPLLALIGPLGNPDQRGAKFRQEFEVRIHRDEPKPVLKGQRGDPEVGIGENPPRPLGLAAQPSVDQGGGSTGFESTSNPSRNSSDRVNASGATPASI